MDFTDFETLDFRQNRNCGRRTNQNELLVHMRGRQACTVDLNRQFAETVADMKYLVVKRQKQTNADYLVFNNDEGMTIRFLTKNKRVYVGCKDLVTYLVKKYGNGRDKFYLKFGENISDTSDQVVCQILGTRK